MSTILQNLTGMNIMTDQVVATELLQSSKTGMKGLAAALAETTRPDVRETLTKQFNEAVAFHGKVSAYMINNGWYHPTDIDEQIRLDIEAAQTALKLGD